MEPKHDHSVEIYEKSPDMNLVISYDENLEINTEPHSSYPWNNHPEITTPMEPKHDHSVEIYEKSPDMNLVISYDENLEINI